MSTATQTAAREAMREAQDAALEAVREAVRENERTQEALRDSIRRARAARCSLRAIGEAAGAHHETIRALTTHQRPEDRRQVGSEIWGA